MDFAARLNYWRLGLVEQLWNTSQIIFQLNDVFGNVFLTNWNFLRNLSSFSWAFFLCFRIFSPPPWKIKRKKSDHKDVLPHTQTAVPNNTRFILCLRRHRKVIYHYAVKFFIWSISNASESQAADARCFIVCCLLDCYSIAAR